MDPEVTQETISHRQRFGLIFGVDFGFNHLESDQDWKTIFAAISNVPWTFFNFFDHVTKTWKWSDVSKGKLPLEVAKPSFKLENVDGACDKVHQLLDSLPQSDTFLLDVICICDKWPKNQIPAIIYGLFRRAASWHGAKLTVLSLDGTTQNLSFDLEDLRLEVVAMNFFCKAFTFDRLQNNVFWRGDVSFFDDSSKQFYDLSNFELSGFDGTSVHLIGQLSCKNKRLLKTSDKRINRNVISRRLKMISKCSMTSIPAFYLTSARFALRSLYSEDSVSDETKAFLELTSSSEGIIARLDFSSFKPSSSFMDSCSDKGPKSKLSTEQWRKWVLNGMNLDDGPSVDDALSGKSSEHIFFLIFDTEDNLSKLCKTCVLLDPSLGGQTRGFEIVHDMLLKKTDPFTPALESVDFSIDVQQFKIYVQNLYNKTWSKLNQENTQFTHDQIHQVVMERAMAYVEKQLKKNLVVKSNFDLTEGHEPVDGHAVPFADEANWEERRFLALLEHNGRMAQERKQQQSGNIEGTMKPSGDFVVMEAKELVKLFDSDGNPKEGTKLEPLVRPRSSQSIRSIDDREVVSTPSSWPGILWSNYPDLYYNRDEKSEIRDRELSKIQQIYVGLRESVSTCNSQNSKKDPEVITKSTNQTQPTAAKTFDAPNLGVVPTKMSSNVKPASVKQQEKTRPRFAASVIRKSPRKMASTQRGQVGPPSAANSTAQGKTQDEMFRQKLRNAVYDALSDKEIDETSPLFRPCFKRLFEICLMYAQDMPPKVKNGGGIKRWLTTVAEQNAEIVVKLEKSLRGAK